MSDRTERQREANAIDLNLYRAADAINSFVKKHSRVLRNQQSHTMEQLSREIMNQRHLFRSLMHAHDREATKGWPSVAPVIAEATKDE